MSKSASKLQEKFIAFKFRGKEIFKPLNIGMIDAGYNYERLREKMARCLKLTELRLNALWRL